MKINPYIIIGTLLMVGGVVLFSILVFPVVREEVRYISYENSTSAQNKPLVPVDTDFGIVIPKINANAPIVSRVDPFDQAVYQQALAKGVAHADGTSLPDEDGAMFLFAHSSVNFLEARQFNSVFYLISKLENGDDIDIYYENEAIPYKVTNTLIVSPDDVRYLDNNDSDTLRLMTCYPAGTTLQRLIVEAEKVSTP